MSGAKVRFEVEIDAAHTAGLAPRILEQLETDPTKREQFAAFALTQALDWMCGRSSHQSMTEQHTAWLTELLPVFFPDEVPTAGTIFNHFSVPYGRASYISRVLLEKQNTDWRARGRQNLLVALRVKEAEAEHNVQNGDPQRYVPISVDTLAYRELTVLLEDLFRADATLVPPVNRAVSPGRRTVDMPSMLFRELVDRLTA